MNAAKFDIVV